MACKRVQASCAYGASLDKDKKSGKNRADGSGGDRQGEPKRGWMKQRGVSAFCQVGKFSVATAVSAGRGMASKGIGGSANGDHAASVGMEANAVIDAACITSEGVSSRAAEEASYVVDETRRGEARQGNASKPTLPGGSGRAAGWSRVFWHNLPPAPAIPMPRQPFILRQPAPPPGTPHRSHTHSSSIAAGLLSSLSSFLSYSPSFSPSSSTLFPPTQTLANFRPVGRAVGRLAYSGDGGTMASQHRVSATLSRFCNDKRRVGAKELYAGCCCCWLFAAYAFCFAPEIDLCCPVVGLQAGRGP